MRDNQQQQRQQVRQKKDNSTKERRTYNRTGSHNQRGRRNGAVRRKPSSVKIIPLGGLGQIGMNITAFECNNQILVVDCGLAFPDEDMLGIDLVIPDVTYLKENAKKIRGLVITHGHEDHIGAIPYIEKELNMPIYATKLTMALIDNKLKEHGISEQVQKNVVSHGDKVKLGIFEVEFIKTNHSIQDAAALAIFSPAGIVLHTGDFKIERQILIYPALNNCYTEESPYPSVRENGKDYLLTAVKMQDYLDLYKSSPEDLLNPYFAPLKEPDLRNMPRTLILTAEFDPLRDEGEDYGRRLREAGNQVEMHRIPDALHGYFALGIQFLHVRESFGYINGFLENNGV